MERSLTGHTRQRKKQFLQLKFRSGDLCGLRLVRTRESLMCTSPSKAPKQVKEVLTLEITLRKERKQGCWDWAWLPDITGYLLIRHWQVGKNARGLGAVSRLRHQAVSLLTR